MGLKSRQKQIAASSNRLVFYCLLKFCPPLPYGLNPKVFHQKNQPLQEGIQKLVELEVK